MMTKSDRGVAYAYQRIFWLEDNPEFFCHLRHHARSTGQSFHLENLLSRITLAYDFQEGQHRVRTAPFDLYILDADFPDVLLSERRAYLDDYMRRLHSRGIDTTETCVYDDGNANETMRWNNFVSFYHDPLCGLGGRTLTHLWKRLPRLQFGAKVVIFSASTDAPQRAYDLGLPFYAKGLEHTKESVLAMAGADHYTSWEHGTIHDFADRYLLK